MPNTMKLITTVTVGAGGAANIDFTSIPQTYTDLCVIYSLRSTASSPYANNLLRFNGNTSSYDMIRFYGDGTTPSSYSNTDIFDVSNGDTSTSNAFGSGEFYIPSYTGSAAKSVIGETTQEQQNTTAQIQIISGNWANASAITQLTLSPTSGTYKQYSTASLYGIKNS